MTGGLLKAVGYSRISQMVHKVKNRRHNGVRDRKTKVGRKLLRFPPTRFFN